MVIQLHQKSVCDVIFHRSHSDSNFVQFGLTYFQANVVQTGHISTSFELLLIYRKHFPLIWEIFN